MHLSKQQMKLKIAVQKSGRLYDESINLLNECGLKVDNTKGQLRAAVQNFNAEIYYLRNADIPKYLEDGVVDLAIIGANVLVENDVNTPILEQLGFSGCRVSIATPKETSYIGLESLEGKKIATSYPKTLQTFLDKKGVKADIHVISGSVEIAPSIGLSDAICDIVSSGSTLFKNGLVEQEIILTSQAVLAANEKSLSLKSDLIDKLRFRMQSVLKAKKYKYILMNAPNEKLEEISKILPVLKSPTVLPLLEKDWSSVHSVISKGDFWNVIDQLKEVGAEDILIIPIEKMVI